LRNLHNLSKYLKQNFLLLSRFHGGYDLPVKEIMYYEKKGRYFFQHERQNTTDYIKEVVVGNFEGFVGINHKILLRW